MKIIGDSIDKAKNAYDSAKAYISTGNANILSTSKKIINIAEKGKAKGELAIEFEED